MLRSEFFRLSSILRVVVLHERVINVCIKSEGAFFRWVVRRAVQNSGHREYGTIVYSLYVAWVLFPAELLLLFLLVVE